MKLVMTLLVRDEADIIAAIEWASVPDNRVRLLSEWRRLNERD